MLCSPQTHVQENHTDIYMIEMRLSLYMTCVGDLYSLAKDRQISRLSTIYDNDDDDDDDNVDRTL